MRPLFVIFALLAIGSTASAQTAPPATVPGEALFVISGRGYGHGVGMSQYGAYGMAKAGRTYDQILMNYYTGIELGTAATRDVRVLLAEGRRAVTIASTAPLIIRDGAGETYRFPAGPLTLRSDLELLTPEGPVVAVPPLVVRAGKSAPLSLDGRLYRGSLQLSVQGGYLRAINVLDLESYLQGVIPGEMPNTWPLEALRAQAVAARSYALANLVKGKPFDLYSDVRSQVYLGLSGEKSRTTEAVSTTAGKVVLYGGKVASTLYFSSSGGKTASALDVFGVVIPYLVSRPDPWDKLPGVLGLAKYPNVHVKFSGAPLLSREPYPHTDLWPNLHKIIDAFTPDRLMWGTDFTRMRWKPGSTDLAPRERWRLYSDCLNYLRDTNELSASDKEKLFGTTIRRVLRWPMPRSRASVP